MAFSDDPDSTPQAKRPKSPATRQRRSERDTERYRQVFAGEPEVHHFAVFEGGAPPFQRGELRRV